MGKSIVKIAKEDYDNLIKVAKASEKILTRVLQHDNMDWREAAGDDGVICPHRVDWHQAIDDLGMALDKWRGPYTITIKNGKVVPE